jgi:hypothetical protein
VTRKGGQCGHSSPRSGERCLTRAGAAQRTARGPADDRLSSSAFRLAARVGSPRCHVHGVGPAWASVTGPAAADLGREDGAQLVAALLLSTLLSTRLERPQLTSRRTGSSPLSGAFLPVCCCRRNRLSSRPPRVAVTCCRRALYAAKRSGRNRVRTADPFPAPAVAAQPRDNRVARPATG